MIVSEPTKRAYQLALRALTVDRIRFVVGGAWAIEHYVALGRATLDLDLMIEPRMTDPAVQALTQHGGSVLGHDTMQVRMDLNGAEIDLVHHIAQGEYAVDATWWQHGVPARLFDVATLVASPADLIWSKVFIASRHRFDGADIVHLIRGASQTIDWRRLAQHLRPYPELLLAYLNLFEFCYPGERDAIPSWLWNDLLRRLQAPEAPGGPKICRGTLLDSTSFIFDGIARGYQDVRQI